MGLIIRGFAAAMMLALLWGAEAQAQRPPKYVRTPYVEVYRDPFGGKHVRTPFAEVHKPGYRMPPVYVGPPIGPTPGAYPGYSYPGNFPPAADLRSQLYGSAAELGRSLQQFSTAATWHRFFGLMPGGALAIDQRTGSFADQDRGELAKLLGRFDSVSQDPQYPMIAALPEFQRTHDLLRVYVADNASVETVPTEELPVPLPDEVRRGPVRR